MKVNLTNGNIKLCEEFPMPVLAIPDVLDRLHQSRSNREVQFSFDVLPFPEILPITFYYKTMTVDIYKLNLYTERMDAMRPDKIAAYKSVISAFNPQTFDEFLQMTYGLDNVSLIPTYSYYNLGKMVNENGMLPEIERCPEKIRKYFDLSRIGRRFAEINGSVMIGDYLCDTTKYESLDIQIAIAEPKAVFRLKMLTAMEKDTPYEGEGKWVYLPCDLEKVASDFGVTQEQLDFHASESALPGLRVNGQKIDALNSLAVKISVLSFGQMLKLKAVMESENITDISGVSECIDRLDEYDFDASVCDCNGYVKAYLVSNLPADADVSAIMSTDLTELGRHILQQKQGSITEYGVLSARGQSLYSRLVMEPEQTVSEEPEEDETEDCDMQIGGMCE